MTGREEEEGGGEQSKRKGEGGRERGVSGAHLVSKPALETSMSSRRERDNPGIASSCGVAASVCTAPTGHP